MIASTSAMEAGVFATHPAVANHKGTWPPIIATGNYVGIPELRLASAELIHRLRMESLLSLEMLAEAASRVLAVVFTVLGRFLFGRPLAQPNPTQALRTAKGLILQMKSLPDRHPLPSENTALSRAVPSLYFHFYHSSHAFSPLPSGAANGHFVQFDGGHADADRHALTGLAVLPSSIR
jgi:hypothetical protein